MVGVVQGGCDESALPQRNGDAHMDLLLENDLQILPSGVELRHFVQGKSNGLQYQGTVQNALGDGTTGVVFAQPLEHRCMSIVVLR